MGVGDESNKQADELWQDRWEEMGENREKTWIGKKHCMTSSATDIVQRLQDSDVHPNTYPRPSQYFFLSDVSFCISPSSFSSPKAQSSHLSPF